MNRRRAEAEGIEVDRLHKPLSSTKAGRIMKHELELPQRKRDDGGARYWLQPARVEQLARRFGVEPLGTSGMSERQSSARTSAENRPPEPINGDSDVSDVNDVSPGVRGAGVETSSTDDPMLADPLG
ncbi:MAG: hypothetical protein KJ749_03975 [Planctomycetes bacterium]|nr:hypothetical protein [Planctomycetota bacterium]